MLGFAGVLFAPASVSVTSISGQADEGCTNLRLGASTETTNLIVSDNWIYNDNDGDVVGLGPSLNIPLRPLMATVGGKDVYTNPNDDGKGHAVAVDGGLQWSTGDSFRLFGEYYYSPDSLPSGINNCGEADTDACLTITCPLNIEAGYHYLDLADKDGNHNNAIVDDSYVGVNASF